MPEELRKETVAGIPKSGPTDPIDYYRRPGIGWLFRERINRGLRLLGSRTFGSVLEVGYGAGVVQLVLATRARQLHGIDRDADPEQVMRLLADRGVQTELRHGDVLELPYEDGAFELVSCFSVIEHLADYPLALREMRRVLQPRGQLLLGMPSVNRMMELGFRAIGFKGIEDHHVTTPAQVATTFETVGLRVVRTGHLQLGGAPPLGLRLYYNWLLERA